MGNVVSSSYPTGTKSEFWEQWYERTRDSSVGPNSIKSPDTNQVLKQFESTVFMRPKMFYIPPMNYDPTGVTREEFWTDYYKQTKNFTIGTCGDAHPRQSAYRSQHERDDYI